jgi:hypothetical protein
MAHDSHAGHVDAEHEYVNPESGSGHEHTDANVSLIIQFAVWLTVAAILTHIGLWFVFGIFVSQRERAGAPEYPLAIEQGPRLPAGPRLQQQPATEMYQFRLQEEAVLNGYSWMDRSAGTVRIPVAEAMRLTVERGLPSRPAAADGAPVVETPGLMPSDGSAGRTMERRRQ